MKAIYAELRSYLTGWKAYFRLSEKPHVSSDLDKWIRRRRHPGESSSRSVQPSSAGTWFPPASNPRDPRRTCNLDRAIARSAVLERVKLA
jgi:hypothetical protein